MSRREPLVDDAFAVPSGFKTDRLIVRPLTIHDAVKDYEAVMTSCERLRGIFGPDDDWPAPDLSLEQDLIDLACHQKEFQRRCAFAYTVMDPAERACLGCVYIEPSERVGYDAQLFFWVRDSALAAGLDVYLDAEIRRWLAREWPCFSRIAWPGRDIDWTRWQALPRA